MSTILLAADPVDPARRRLQSLLQAIGASVLAKVVALGCSLVSVPILLGHLGTDGYGVWATITSLLGMLVFADLGVGNGVMNAVARANGRQDAAGVREAVAGGLILLTLVSAGLLAVFLLAWPWVDWGAALAVPADVAPAAGWAVLAVVALFAVGLPFLVMQKAQYGTQNGRWVSASQAAAAVLGLLFTIAAVQLDAGLVVLVACFSLAAVLANIAIGAAYANRYPAVVPTRADWKPSQARKLLRVGLAFLVMQAGVALCFASDNLIVAHVLGQAHVAEYAVHQKLFSPLAVVAGLALVPLWPAFADAHTRGDRRWIAKTLRVTVASMLLLGLAGGLALVLGADWLMRHWLRGRIEADTALCIAFAVWAGIELVGRSIAMFLNGAAILRPQLIVTALFVPLCIGLKIVFAGSIGLHGVVIATAVAWLVVHVPAYSWLLLRWARAPEAR